MAIAVEAPTEWHLEGDIGPEPGEYALSLETTTANAQPMIVAARSSCECLSVVRSTGKTIYLRLRRRVPSNVVPYLHLKVRLERTRDGIEILDLSVPMER